MKSSSGAISIAASAQRLDVDNRISLRYYYRIADNLIKQANIYRAENNIIDLYVMLLRFSSLITETIPYHRDYQVSLQSDRLYFKKKLLSALNELEELKPDVQQRVDELNRKTRKVNKCGLPQQNGFVDNSLEWPPVRKQTVVDNLLEWPPVRKQTLTNNKSSQVHKIVGQDGASWNSVIHSDRLPLAKPGEEQFHKFYLNIPRPKEETLSRHSILGANGLHGQWKAPSTDRGIQYPSNLDLSPIEIPSLTQPEEDTPVAIKDDGTSGNKRSTLEEVLSLHDDRAALTAEPSPMINLDATGTPMMDITREPSPPPVLAEVQDMVAVTSEVSNSLSGQTVSLQDELVQTESPLQVHISTTMMDNFMRLAKSNTVRNLETCGVLGGSLKNRKFYVTALIIPKQESTSDSCQTTNEEEIFDYQDKQSLFPLGWIHTHPTQSCFMSSIDLHTHYSYQIMLPEAIAIVMAPKDGSRTHGIFRLTSPGGMSVIRQCQQRGFHPHKEPPDGGRIYDNCSYVFMNPNLKFDVVDLR